MAQKRTTKILRQFCLLRMEWHLIDVNHKCFFPGRKYRIVKVSVREKAQREPRSCTSAFLLGRDTHVGKSLQPPPPGPVPLSSQSFPCAAFEEVLFLGGIANTVPTPSRAALDAWNHIPTIVAQSANLLFLVEFPLLCW